MTYDQVAEALAGEGFFTYYREDTATLVCSSAQWPNVPQNAHSFWLAERRGRWYLGTWAPHVYQIGNSSKVPALCIAWLRQHIAPAQWDVDMSFKREFQLVEIQADDLP